MKIACCQFDPQWSKVEENMATASQLLEKYQQGDINLLVLPEMAFTGYVFKSKEEIEPFLEDEETGPSVQWAKSQAIRLSCFVMVGYPQRGKGKLTEFLNPPGKLKILKEHDYNSICFINPQGERVLTYQKSFLYETDESWASEGPGFVSTKIEGLGQVGFGICMDLNPYQFKTSFYQFEFANYHLQHQTDLIVCSMAWLKGSGEDSTVEYWASRLLPLCSKTNPTLLVVCNRTGSERGSEFAGSSCVLNIYEEKFKLLGQLKREAAVLWIKTEQ